MRLFTLLQFCLLLVQTHGFASYLLTKGGCWTELSAGEAIMGASVLGVEEQDKTHGFHISVDGIAQPNDNQFAMDESELPKKLSLQLVSSQDLPSQLQDYQWVMDIVEPDDEHSQEDQPSASFVNGGCENSKRIAGRAIKKVELTIHSLPVTIVAGWAPGHEAVKLVPTLSFVAKSTTTRGRDNNAVETNQHDATVATALKNGALEHQESTKRIVIAVDEVQSNADSTTGWANALVSPDGCQMQDFDEMHSFLQKHQLTLDSDKEYPLVLQKKEGSVPAQATLKFKDNASSLALPKAYQLVLHTSLGTSFEQGLCNDQRRILIHRDASNIHEPWPALVIHETSNPIIISGLLSDAGDDPSIKTIHRISTTFEWSDDPQSIVDGKNRVETTLQRQIHRQAGVKRNIGNERAVPADIRHHAHGESRQKKYYNDKGHRHGFVGGTSWYLGMLVLLAGPCFILPLCLHFSQTSRRKGRISKAN
ncbi:hypothetical protein MPSEU_000034600 [Mayamaea pseudoterrestris]|nr:hypothetical protein MPSEU_000034600 [Mayamaea pseudoterrestris]